MSPSSAEPPSPRSSKIALCFVYNHRFDRNIERLERMHADRFSTIHHIVPFYDGPKRAGIVPVHENSYQFQGYFTQALPAIYDPAITQYVFCGDDLLLNPDLTETSFNERVGLAPAQGYVKRLRSACEVTFDHRHLLGSLNAVLPHPSVEAFRELPSYEEAERLIVRHGIDLGRIGWRNLSGGRGLFYPRIVQAIGFLLANRMRELKTRRPKPIPAYPLLFSYSDLLVVPAASIEAFCRLCGIFAAMRVFVEYAAPTALAMTCDSILTLERSKMRGVELWGDEIARFEEQYGRDLNRLRAEYPRDRLYVHPIKLSRWSGDIRCDS